MAYSKFKLGDQVEFIPSAVRRARGLEGPYEIIRPLPPEGSNFSYRIRDIRNMCERVALESELIKMSNKVK
jgi:hypothetical protein